MKKLTSSLVLVLLAAAGTQAQAQSASISATATVQTALTIAAVDPLAFGSVFPGVTKVVAPSDLTSGSWSLAGAPNAEVTLTFTLPANLSDGVNNLPIVFGGSSAGYNTANSRAGLTLVNPTAVATTRLDGVSGNLYVFIGGSVSPTTEPAGAYTGSITLATAYTGN
jgi:hypothetical protein